LASEPTQTIGNECTGLIKMNLERMSMNKYTMDELNEAKTALVSTLRKCEKIWAGKNWRLHNKRSLKGGYAPYGLL